MGNKELLYKNLESILIKINYDSSKTLTENKKIFYEQSVAGAPSYGTFTRDEDAENARKAEKEAATYPNYCKYPKNAIVPGKNKQGLSGVESIPEGKCAYLAPLPGQEPSPAGPKYSVVFIDQESEIVFNTYDTFAEIWEKLVSETPQLKNIKPENRSILIKNYLNVFPLGTVYSFNFQGLEYVTTWKRIQGHEGFNIVFDWYKRVLDDKPYPTYDWYDPRNQWQKIVDDWGDAAQWIAAGAFFIAQMIPEIGPWIYIAEIAVEGTLGVINAQRHLERGMNTAAAFDLLFSMTPFLKNSPLFKGINPQVSRNLVSSMYKAGIRADTAPEKIVEWYLTLGKNEQKLFSKMIKAGDELSTDRLARYLGEGLDEFKNYVKANPDILTRIKWYENLGILELSANLSLTVIDMLVDTFLGHKLNDAQKQRCSTIFNEAQEIDYALYQEVLKNFYNYPDKLPEILDTKSVKELENDLVTKPATKNAKDYLNSKLKHGFEEAGVQYWEDPEDKTKPTKEVGMDDLSVQNWEKNNPNYTREDKIKRNEWVNYESPIYI